LDIRIRGIATNGDAKPLIIDGYIGELGLLNPMMLRLLRF
jgi:hypothetical protein